MKNFLLTFDIQSGRISNQKIIDFLKSSTLVESWAQTFSGSFVIKSESEFDDLRDALVHLFSNHTQYLLIAADIHDTAGLLPGEVWDWINKGVLSPEVAKALADLRAKNDGEGGSE